MNYWDGFCWRKKPLEEGDSIILNIAYTDGSGHTSLNYEDGLVAVHDVEFRIIDGVLVAVNDVLFESVVTSVENTIGSQVDELRQMIEDETERAENAEAELSGLVQSMTSVTEDIEDIRGELDGVKASLSAETDERNAVDVFLQEQIDAFNGRLINSGSTFSVSSGFAFSHDDPENNYTLFLDGNFGEIPED